jgi:uncharacterized protein YfaS (alpha-2-macroglobulin family)
MQYPHGCVEQTTSAVFPQLFLDRIMELNGEQKRQIQNNVSAGINRLKSFQVSGGGLTYWPGSSTSVSEWGTSYAGHFMLEAEMLGYAIPAGFLSNWIKFQTRAANSWDRETGYFVYRRSNEINQAYRLYTLALAGKPALGAMNRMREMNELSVTSRWTLAAAYLLAGKTRVAENLVNGLTTTVSSYRELSYTYGSTLRDQAMILQVITRMGDMVKAKILVEEIAEKMASTQWYSTQTTAYVLLAIGKFVGNTESSETMNFEYTLNGKKQEVSTPAPMFRVELPYDGKIGGTLNLSNTQNRSLFVTLQLDGIPLDPRVEDEASDIGMDIRYLTLDGRELDVSTLEQGTDFMAQVSLSHPGIRVNYKELALTQMFPSGWEIRNLRLDQMESSLTQDQPEYQDIRDDRVYSYFGLNKNETKTFVILLNAAYLGDFFLPAVYCEAMYDNTIHATKAGQKVKVIKQR